MTRYRILSGIFTVLAVASFCVTDTNGADSVAGWSMLIIANIYGSKID